MPTMLKYRPGSSCCFPTLCSPFSFPFYFLNMLLYRAICILLYFLYLYVFHFALRTWLCLTRLWFPCLINNHAFRLFILVLYTSLVSLQLVLLTSLVFPQLVLYSHHAYHICLGWLFTSSVEAQSYLHFMY